MSDFPPSSILATGPFPDGPEASEANDSSANSSRGGSGNHRVRFGSGEALDVQNNRHTFDLRSPEDYQSSDSGSPVPDSPAIKTPPITLISSNTSPSGGIGTRAEYFSPPNNTTDTPVEAPALPLKTPPKAIIFSRNDEDLELNEKYDKFTENDRLSSQERAARLGRTGSYSAPSSAHNSVHNSPTLTAYSVGAGQAQGGVPVDDIPLPDLGNTPLEDSSGPGNIERNKVAVTREAYELVRQHTTRGVAVSSGLFSVGRVETSDHSPRSGTTTPVAHQHEGYVQPPSQYRGGVLGSLLKLYNPPGNYGNHYDIGRRSSMGRAGSPTSSGRPTSKWYNRSANTSTTSLGGLLAASATPPAPTGPAVKKDRPKMRHRPHSVGSVVGALRSFSRSNLEEEIRVSYFPFRFKFRLGLRCSCRVGSNNWLQITVHIAETLVRQKYILKLCRALMLYGAPTHRLEGTLEILLSLSPEILLTQNRIHENDISGS